MTGFTRAGDNGRLTLAVPAKGRMAEPALRLCADAGLSFEVTERSLVVPCANAPVDLLLVRPSDIPEYAQDGVVDVGITGANLVAEADAEAGLCNRLCGAFYSLACYSSSGKAPNTATA